MSDPIKLEPCNIRDVWDRVRPGLEEIKESWPLISTWRPEDVYAEVLAGRAELYENEDGFAVCILDTDEYSGETDLGIWIAYAYKDKRGGILRKWLPSFIERARLLGCTGVSTISNHLALAQIKELTPLYTRYRVSVNGEET